MNVDGKTAHVSHRGTLVFVRTVDRVWWVNTPDALDLVEEFSEAENVTRKVLEARGFHALK